MRLKDKIAIVIGAGQSPGEGMGNGRATCIRFAQEGAKVLAVDNRMTSAVETAELRRRTAGNACRGGRRSEAVSRGNAAGSFSGSHRRANNVGVSLGGGDATISRSRRGV